MKQKVLVPALAMASLAVVNASADAYDFSDNVYGRANAKIGYTFSGYTGDIKDWIEAQDNHNKFTQGINIGGGYDVYYKVNNFVNPFAGLEVQFRIPVSSRIDEEGLKIQEFFRFNARFGARMNICKNLAIAPYALVGLNVLKEKQKASSYSDVKAGLSTGAGIETIINNRFTAGLEYRYGLNKFQGKGRMIEHKVQSHSFAANFGVQFL